MADIPGIIEGAKVKSVQAQYGKISAAMNIFFEKYGFYPGDGCTSANTLQVGNCTAAKDITLSSAAEQSSFWSLLNSTNILPLSEKKNAIGAEVVHCQRVPLLRELVQVLKCGCLRHEAFCYLELQGMTR
jgi:hypothetical protein